MKKLICALVFVLVSTVSFAQLTLEQQVADSTCTCLSAIDTVKINSQGNGLKMACLQKALIQNKEAITKEYSTTQRKEEDEAKRGLQGSLMIKVQNELSKNCAAYNLFQQKIQERRMP
jgi:hypothetical protein